MAITILGPCGSAQVAGGASSVAITVTANVPRTIPSIARIVWLFIQVGNLITPGSGPAPSTSDNATLGSTPNYGATVNQGTQVLGGTASTASGGFECNILPHVLYRALSIGDIITVDWGAYVYDWIRVTTLAIEGGGIVGSAAGVNTAPLDQFSSTGFPNPAASSAGGGGNGVDPFGFSASVLSNGGPVELNIIYQQATPGVTALMFNDGSLVTFDSWYDQSSEHASGITGYATGISGTVDVGASTDTAAGTDDLIGGALFLLPGVGFPYPFANPVFTGGFRTSD